MPARRGACWSETRGPGCQGECAGSHQWPCPQREVHTTTPACLCRAHAWSRCAHWRLPTLMSFTHSHIHNQPCTQRPTDTPHVHTHRIHTPHPQNTAGHSPQTHPTTFLWAIDGRAGLGPTHPEPPPPAAAAPIHATSTCLGKCALKRHEQR